MTALSPHHRSVPIAGARLFAALLIALLCALAPDAQAQIGLGTVRSAFGDGTSVVNITSVIISGADRALVVGVCHNNNDAQAPSTVVIDPGGGSQTSLTWLDNAAGIYSDDGYCHIWGVANPPAGTFTVRVTLTSATQGDEGLIAGAWPLTGVDQTTPFGTAVGDGASSGNASVTVSSGTGDLVLGAAFVEGYDGTRWIEGSDIEDWDLTAVDDVSAGEHKDGEASSTTLNWTNDSWSGKWASIGVAVKPAPPDSTPPDAVADLATGTVTTSSVQLTWTAPGDDGSTGTATTYDVRYSTSTITAGNWATATQATGEPSPQIAGSGESFTVTGLSEATTYYFAIKASDEKPNESAISNVASATTATTGPQSWVAVGDSGTVYKSVDGVTWGPASDTAAISTTNLRAVAYNGTDRWIAVGASGLIYGSADGDVWSQLFDVGSTQLEGVAYGNGRWMAAGASNIYRSTDNGANWSSVYSSADAIRALAYDGSGRWSVYGGNQDIWGSTNDGDSWTQHLDNSSNVMGSIAYDTGAGLWITTGNSNDIWHSSNGTGWTYEDGGSFHTFGIAVDQSGTWVRVGESAKVFYGSVGSWSSQDLGSEDFRAVAHDNSGLWVMTSDAGKIHTAATPGSTWTERADVGTAIMYGVAHNHLLPNGPPCPAGAVCWDGGAGADTNWSNGLNWTGDAVPLDTDLVVFNGLSTNNATFDVADTIVDLTIEAGYTGTITMAADLLIDNAGACAFTQNGGTIDLGSTTWTHECDWTYTAGTFTAGTSTVVFSYTGITIDSGTSVFNDVDISMATNTDFTVTGTMDVNGNLTVSQVRDIETGTIAVAGNVTTTDISVGGTGTITLDGTGAQVLGASGGTGALPGLNINKSGGGTLTIQDTIEIDGYLGSGWTYTAGTVDAGTSTVVFATATGVNSGSMKFNNVILDSSTGQDLTVTGTMDVDGDLTITTVRNVKSGTITVAGNLTSTQTGVGNSTGLITLDGTKGQLIDIGAGDVPDGLFTISTGYASLGADLLLNGTGQDLALTTGTLDMAGFDLTIPDVLTLEAGTIIYQCGGTLTYGSLVNNGGTIDAGCATFKDPTADAARAGLAAITPANAYTSDDTYGELKDTTQHDYRTYDFCISPGATIQGVEVRTEWHTTKATDTGFLTLQLIDSAGLLVGTSKTTSTIGGTTDVTHTLGGPADSWGASLTDAIVNDANFGVSLLYTKTAGGGGNHAFVDNVDIQVSYTGGSGACEPTLIARYWMEEAASGQSPTQLVDDQPGQLNLPITYDTTRPSYIAPSTGRGWTSDTVSNNGRASVLVDGTKIQTTLDGSTKASLEVVVRIDAVNSNTSRLIHIGDSSESGYFTLSTNPTNIFFNLFGDGTLRGQWGAPWDGTRKVFHLVYDSTQATAADRVKLYQDGVLQSKTGGTDPPLNETISVPNLKYFAIGNRELGGRSVDGDITYAAVYDGALSASDISSQATALLANDDSGPPSGPAVQWEFDEGSGQTAADSSGNSRDATLGSTGSGDTSDPAWMTCAVGGNALSFDGVDDYIEDPDGELYTNGLTAFTASAWIKSDVTGTDRGFLHTIVPDGSDGVLGIRYDAAGSQSGFTNVIKVGLSVDGVNQLLESSANIQTTNWQHVAVTWSSGNQFALYLDGGLDTPGYNEPGRVGSLNNATTLFVGKGGKADVTGGWDGLIDQVRLYDRVLSAAEISALAATVPSGCATVPVGHWTFDEGSGQTAADSSGNTNSGTLGVAAGVDSSDPTWMCVTGGNALNFDGTDDVVEVLDAPELVPTGDMTLAAWVKLDTLPSVMGEDAQFVHKRHSVAPWFSYQLQVEAASDKPKFLWRNTAGVQAIEWGSSALSTGTWYHVTGVRTGTALSLYVDGVDVGTTSPSTSGSILDSDDDLSLGAAWSGGGRLAGGVDDVRIYDRALSPAEITALAATAPSDCAAGTLFRSVGTDATDLNVGARTAEITGTTATFSGSMPDNVGVGDVLQYQVAATWYAAFISGRTSTTVYTLKSATGGTPQAAPALTAVNVYRAYTSLYKWETQDENDSLNDAVENFDTSKDLVSANTVMQVAAYADAPDTNSSQVSIGSDWVTGANNYIRIYTPVSTSEVGVSQRHTGIAGTGYVRRPTVAGTGSHDLFQIDTNYVRLEGLDFDGSMLTGSIENLYGIRIQAASGSTDIRIEQCLIHDLTNSNNTPASARYVRGIYSRSGYSQDLVKIANTVVYGISNINTNSGSSANGMSLKHDLGASYVFNNTFFDIASPANTASGHGMRLGGGATHYVKNNYVGLLSCVTCTYTTKAFRQGETATINADNNVSFDDSADDFAGANNVINQAAYASYFVNVTAGSENLHLLADSNALWGVYGADLDSDPNLPVTIDIDGEARDSVQPDVGADEQLGAGPASASVSGTILASVTESHIVVGGKTLVITLVNDTWDATVGADNAATTALINGLDSDGVEATGWDAAVLTSLTFNEVVRTSDTVVTITLPAQAGYDISAAETITVTVPVAAVAGTNPIVATPTFDVIPVTAVVTGTITASATESHIVAGGRTLEITLVDDTWDATIGASNAATTALINGLDSNGVEVTGWDAEVKANLTFNDVVRTSDTVVTVTLSAQAGYDISAAETIIVTVPATAVAGGAAIVASPTFNVQVVSAAITGTITASANESHIVVGGRTVVITLTNDTWVASGATFNAERQGIINGLDSAQAEGSGWDAVVKAGVAVSDVVRTSDTVVTITLPAFASYDITADETVTATLPATALIGGSAMGATPSFSVAALTGPIAAVSGTISASTTEAEIVSGGETLVITLSNDTWLAAGAAFDAQRQNIIDGLDSAQAEATGWDAVVKAGLAVTDVVRTSTTVVTITLPAFASYDTTANETITATVPASAVTGASPIVATPTFDIAYVAPATATATGTITPAATEPTIVSGGRTLVLTLAGETWVTAGALFDAERQNLIDGLVSAQAEATGWNGIVKAGLAVTDVVRTSATVVTITLPAFASYDITARETITATVPATAVTGGSQMVATPTFDIVLSVSGQEEFPSDGVFTVPAGVTELTIKAWGGGGGGGSIDTGSGGDGGGGGYVEHLVTGVSTGETFSIAIGRGAEGGNSCGSHLGGAGGYPGGDGVIDSRGNDGGGTGSGGLGGDGYLTLDGGDGKWGAGSGAGDTLYGGGGGGASVVTDDQSSTEIVIAGGGGGGGTAWSTFWGGAGGPGCALVGGNGSTNGSGGGGGGACLGQTTQNGSGQSPGNAAEAGGAGQGGDGNSTSCTLKDGTDGKVVIVYGSGASATLGGTLVPSVSKSAIVAGGRTLTITLTDDVWDATIGASNAKTTALINAIDSDGAEATGWDAVVKANLTFNEVVRTSDTLVTITLLAEATYDITSMETIRLSVPATAVTGTSDIVALPSFKIDPLTVITGIRVAAATDDAEEMLGSGAMDLASLALQMIDDSGAQRVGLRFQNVAVPTGAVITAAYLEFTNDVANPGSADLTIEGQAADNPGTFASGSGDITSRPTTSASVPWAVPAWDTAGQTHQSPSLVPIVQELIDRPGWTSGNALVVLVSGTGRRTARSYDANPAEAPLLHIDYVPDDPACDDGNPCTYDFWDAGSASCLYDAAAADGAACSDGLYCSTGNVCSAGSCGLPIDCSFMDTQCAVGVCDEAADACLVGTESWFDTNWLFRKPITIDSTKVTGDLDDFPVLVSITDPDLAASARADGFDIAFTGSNGSTKLDHEIEKYDGGTGELVAWVRVRLSASQDKNIYMYYGNATAGDQQNATGVWNASYISVYHMKESPDGSGGGGSCTAPPTVYSAAVSTTYAVPAGCDTLTVKAWGAGGGGGGGFSSGHGAAGGGGGFAQADISVTPGESLTITLGGGGAGGGGGNVAPGIGGGTTTPIAGGGTGGNGAGDAGAGGGGGGYAAVLRSSTFLVQAGGGGGGGGGGDQAAAGSAPGGAGGGTSGLAGTSSPGSTGGGAGTASAGGAAGSSGGTAGSANSGGNGGNGSGDTGGGGGGGGGRFGAGGGGRGGTDNGGSGGGGGSGFVTGTNTTLTAGSGTTPGANTDPDYAATAGVGGAAAANGNPGRIVLIPSGSGGGGGGDVLIADSTANAHDGTTYGTMDSADSVAGQIANALDFDGTDDYMDLPAAATSGLSQFAFSLWVKTTEAGTSGTYWQRPTLFGQSTTTQASGDLGITTNNGYIAFWTGIQPVSDDDYVSSTLQVNDNAWHHVLVSNDGASAGDVPEGVI